ncbi:MAG: MBL fold metallo-hydrolase [Chloroflexota bacterium]|nr:MBL fold metallo-hydrolase [Chloroflexota bacterium]
MANITFHGGVGEIGGNKILIEADGARVWLDFGMSFNQSNKYFAEFLQPKRYNGVVDFLEMGLLPRLPDMGGLYRQDYLSHADMSVDSDPAYDAVFLSHAHADHANYIHFLRSDIPIYASDVSRRILAATEETSGSGGFSEFLNLKESFKLRPSKRGEGLTKVKGEEANIARGFHGLDGGERIAVGDIEIEPVPVNHSIPGACGYLIHTSQGTIAYTGDLRFHGYGGELTEAFVRRAAESKLIALICEGTRIDQEEGLTEYDVQEKVSDVVRRTKSLVIANYPWKDIERLRSFHEVARVTGRKLALNLKQAYLLNKLEGSDAGAPSLDDDNIVIYVDRKGWGLITKANGPDYPDNIVKQDYATWEREFLDLPNCVTCDDIHRNQGDYIVRIDFFDLTDLINIRPHEGSSYIWSKTEPFDEEGEIEQAKVENWLRHFGLFPYEKTHVSGHASGPEINRLIESINPKVLFPVHTEHPEMAAAPKGVEIIVPNVGEGYRV